MIDHTFTALGLIDQLGLLDQLSFLGTGDCGDLEADSEASWGVFWSWRSTPAAKLVSLALSLVPPL